MKRIAAARLAFVLAAGAIGCAAPAPSRDAPPIETIASVPSAEEIRTSEDAQAAERRRGFVEAELVWILERARSSRHE
jgi:hypothetical protein